MKLIVLILTVLYFCNNVICEKFTPIVLWHGMGNAEIYRNRKGWFFVNCQMVCSENLKITDVVTRWPGTAHDSNIFNNSLIRARLENKEFGDSCCFPFSLGAIKKRLEETLPGVYVRSLQLGDSLVQDVENGYFMHPDKQVEQVCEMIRNDSELQQGYNALGFSQGAQFLRAIAQKCPSPQMKTLVSLGGQHQGVYGLPNCGSLSHPACDYIRKLLNHAAYLSWVQHFLVQATYWHDPLHEDSYVKGSTFLADINNEDQINTTYIANLQKLQNFVLVKFADDTIVQPVETEWFGFYKPGQDKVTVPLQEMQIYTQDRLGLNKMEKNGQLHFLSTPGNHLQFDWDWFTENIIEKFLKK